MFHFMKITRTILLASAFGFFLASCNKIDAPYYTVKGGGGDTTKITRKVLLEDYTGHKCPNCPEAAITAHTLEETYNGKVIVMAVHAGYFADSSATGDFTANYKTSAGDEWNSYFPIISYPSGLVNRKAFQGSVIIGNDLWAEAVDSIVNLPADAIIQITNTYNTSTRQLNMTVDSKFLNELLGKYNLTICILEDSIISPQKNSNPNIGPTPIIYDYVFMHMLRGSLNGTWGDELTSLIDTSLIYSKTYSTILNPIWIPKNCSVLAFISNTETKEIIQAEEKPIIQ